MMKENILGYNVDAFSADECADELFGRLRGEGRNSWLACFNPHSYALSLKDELFPRALKAADWLVPDGTGVVLASGMLGGRIKDRVTGSDVFAGLNKRLDAAGNMRVFFLGATEESLALIRQRMAQDYPGITIAGTFSPPFKEEFSEADNRVMIEMINKARPDVLWVGMSAPKQEKWIYLNKERLEVPFIAAVGAVFDFYAGTIRREMDSWVVNHGLEWLLRLVQEPRRLWRRTFVSAPVFFWNVFRERLRKRFF